MASIDQLEKKNASLKSNERELVSAVEDADTQLQILKDEKVLVKQDIAASKRRYQKLKMLSKSVCSDCWVILPALGPDVCKKAEDQARNPLSNSSPCSCVNCGASVIPNRNARGVESSDRHRHQASSIKLPPEGTTRLLERSKNACQESRDILNGTLLSRGNAGHYRPSISISISMGRCKSSGSALSLSDCSIDSDDCTTAALVGKVDYLEEVSRQKKKARQRRQKVDLAFEKWMVHKENHETELQRVRKVLEKVATKECCLLEDRLEKLGCRSKSRPAASSPSSPCCDICLEPPKSKIVFQCGHHCCSACADAMTKCHMCRKLIQQRIRLFE
jgi:hypothetical protein